MLNTREKLIDVFMHMGDHIRSLDEYGFCFDSTLAEAIEYVVAMLKNQDANGVTVQKWIPVTERLPDVAITHNNRWEKSTESVHVLCCCKQKSGKRMVKEGSCKVYSDGTIYWAIPGTIDSVTHWMPLPEPPKGE